LLALVRYLGSDVARSQTWVPPFLVYVTLCLADIALGGGTTRNSLPTFATDAAFLLPVAIWVTVAVGNCEDVVQASITVATVGSETKVRLAKLLVAYLGCAVLSVFSVAVGWASTGLASPGVTLEGFAAHLTSAAAGVGVGALCMRPVLDRRAWAVLAGVFATLAELIVPDCPPVRQFLVLMDASRPSHLPGGLALIGLESLALSSALVGAAIGVGRART